APGFSFLQTLSPSSTSSEPTKFPAASSVRQFTSLVSWPLKRLGIAANRHTISSLRFITVLLRAGPKHPAVPSACQLRFQSKGSLPGDRSYASTTLGHNKNKRPAPVPRSGPSLPCGGGPSSWLPLLLATWSFLSFPSS